MIERTLDHRFLPGYVAFPGGAVDDEDSPLAERWFGDLDEAARAAAVRELAEEVALAVTVRRRGGGPRGVGPSCPSIVRRLLQAAPRGRQVDRPPRVPVRFDARYYAVRMDGAADPGRRGGGARVVDLATVARRVGGRGRAPVLADALHGHGAGCLPGRRRAVGAADRDARARRGRARSLPSLGVLPGSMIEIHGVLAPNPSVYTLEGTNTWIVGGTPAIVIDPGPDDARASRRSRGRPARSPAVLVTHDHPDHAPGAAPFARLVRPLLARRPGADPLRAGQRIARARWTSSRSTPRGSSPDHVAFHDRRAARSSPVTRSSAGARASSTLPREPDAVPTVARATAGGTTADDVPGSRAGRRRRAGEAPGVPRIARNARRR